MFNVHPIISLVKVLTVIRHWCKQPDHPTNIAKQFLQLLTSFQSHPRGETDMNQRHWVLKLGREVKVSNRYFVYKMKADAL